VSAGYGHETGNDAKDGLLACKKPSFTTQYAAFRNAKGRTLENGRARMIPHVAVRCFMK